MVSIASLLGARYLVEVVANKPASSHVVSLGKALNGMSSSLCERQVAETPRKWQLLSECGRPVQNIAIRFAFSLMEDKYGKKRSFFNHRLDCPCHKFFRKITLFKPAAIPFEQMI